MGQGGYRDGQLVTRFGEPAVTAAAARLKDVPKRARSSVPGRLMVSNGALFRGSQLPPSQYGIQNAACPIPKRFRRDSPMIPEHIETGSV